MPIKGPAASLGMSFPVAGNHGAVLPESGLFAFHICGNSNRDSTFQPLPARARLSYMVFMRDVLLVLLGIDMIAVVAVLLTGAVGMGTGADPRRQNMLMRWRVGLQAVAIALVVVLLLSSRT